MVAGACPFSLPALLESVELKLALTHTNDLSAALALYLPAILRKLDSSAPARQKTLEIIGSLAKRVRSEGAVVVPVAGILELLSGTTTATTTTTPPSDLLKTMGMILVEMGISRMDKEEAGKMLPMLVRGIGSGGANSGAWRSAAFGVFLSVSRTSDVLSA